MTDRTGQRTTFESILAEVGARNSRRLMSRATIANRLAKTLRGRARKRAYDVKHSALLSLSMRFPKTVTICNDPQLPGFVIVGDLSARFGLHAPIRLIKTPKIGDGLVFESCRSAYTTN